MTGRQNAKLSMYNVVITVQDNNTAKVATIAALVTTVTGFKATADAITNMAEQQTTITTGTTPDKNVTRESLRNNTVINGGILHAYAVSVNNIVLMEQTKIYYTSLKNLKDDELAARAQAIHDLAAANIASLPPFGITAAVLTSFQSLIDAYQAKSSVPRAAQSQQVALTKQLTTLFKQADAQLKDSMDKLMLNFKTTDPEYYNTYIAAREIMDPATSATQVKGTVLADVEPGPLMGVIIEVVGKSYTTTTDVNGEYILKIPVHGTYSLKFTHAGYQDKTINNVVVTIGNTTHLNVTLNVMSV